MRKILVITGIAALVALLGVATLGAVVFAQDSEDGPVVPFDFQTRFQEAVSEFLGVSVEEYEAAVDQAQQQVVDEALAEGWLTEEQAERMQERFEKGFGPAMKGPGLAPLRAKPGRPGGPRRGGFAGRPADGRLALTAEVLDVPVEDLVAALKDGQTIAEVAAAQGVDTQAVVDAHLEALSERLDRAVENGRMTEKQAQWLLEQAQTQIERFTEEGRPFDGCKAGHRWPDAGPGD